ncbi:hypothetical protein PJU52_006127 [Klebsiella michiganensis]|uniref:hypothetical protein n=1 Tax=Klebsiella michiganensis TaxID=1134687 RepID=UPI001D18ABCB|nr:hypothetical protein [Klebsiella michiganensis]MCW9671582.1 hypothetical protein [Klebsiella michiganensis]MDM4164518.1 hypothetical protein [Klebsiella michiganensis]
MKRKKGSVGVLCFFLITVSSNLLVNIDVQSHSLVGRESTTTAIGVNLYIDFKHEKK